MERKQESATIKRALIQKGFDKNNVSVKHGNGTAWGWLHIKADIHRAPNCSCGEPDQWGRRETCEECKKLWSACYARIEEITIEASGRNKYEAEQINYQLGFFN